LTELDLTPRTATGPAAPGAERRRRLRNGAILTVIAVVLGLVLYQALSSARVYFYNVDEAVERRAELGEDRFRMQGAVVDENGVDASCALLFSVAFGEAATEVRHVGDEPSGLFELGQNVVVEGHWDGDVFVSDQILVKHSETYVEANPERFDDGATPNSAEPGSGGDG
jgi:cytochrome c-type biogenesis protein CcmE